MGDTLLVRTSRMTGVEIDAAARTARVEAGALWRDVMVPASEHGLAALCGSSPDVGVVGYSLGGGVGYLGRRYGLQTNSVTAIELVTAEGESVRTDAEHDPDLFWALRGGGGNFGAVTALECALYPVAELHAGWLAWPWEKSEVVLRAWRDWTDGLPDEVTTMARLIQFPPVPDVPAPVRGRQLVVVSGGISAAAKTARAAPPPPERARSRSSGSASRASKSWRTTPNGNSRSSSDPRAVSSRTSAAAASFRASRRTPA